VISWFHGLKESDLREDNDGVLAYRYDCEFNIVPVESEDAVKDDGKFDERSGEVLEHECGIRQYHEELENGTHPKQCIISSDCRMVSGFNGECICGMDGSYWCRAEWGSSVYDLFWTDCDKDNDRKVKEEVYLMWKFWREHYTDFVSAPTCAESLVEWETYNDLKDDTREYGLLVIAAYALLAF
jgi:hypothetical protein